MVFTNVYINSMEVSRYGAESPGSSVGTITTDLRERVAVQSGEVVKATIWVGTKFGFLTSGNTVKVQIAGEGGIKLVKNVVLS